MARWVPELMRPTRTWSEIADRYRPVRDCEPMLRLVEHIARAPYADKLFGCTSMFTLIVAQTPEIREDQEIIRVEYEDDGFVVTLHERGWRSSIASDDPIARRVPAAEGVAAFERLLRAKRWD